MQGKIILNLAISLDGFIADIDGGYDWIVGDGDRALNTDNKFDFNDFLEEIDIVLMGSKCYEQGMAEPFSTKTVYVATSQSREGGENIKFISGDITRIVADAKAVGKNIFLFGGGQVIDPFIKEDIIDEYIIGVIPTILGAGRKLFLDNNPTIRLHLDAYTIDEGVMILRYSKKA